MVGCRRKRKFCEGVGKPSAEAFWCEVANQAILLASRKGWGSQKVAQDDGMLIRDLVARSSSRPECMPAALIMVLAGADVSDASSTTSTSALHEAVKAGHDNPAALSLVEALLSSGADPNHLVDVLEHTRTKVEELVAKARDKEDWEHAREIVDRAGAMWMKVVTDGWEVLLGQLQLREWEEEETEEEDEDEVEGEEQEEIRDFEEEAREDEGGQEGGEGEVDEEESGRVENQDGAGGAVAMEAERAWEGGAGARGDEGRGFGDAMEVEHGGADRAGLEEQGGGAGSKRGSPGRETWERRGTRGKAGTEGRAERD
eukprot:jgi/Mesvir1/19677/Mv09949-RA.1